MTPSLRSSRLILHAHSPALVTQEHVDWLNDKDLMRYSEQRHREHTLRTQLDYVRDESPQRKLWLIRCEGVDIGTLAAYVDENNKRCDLGILIGRREYHGQGFAAEAWTAVINYFFDNGLNKIECGCQDDNWPMRRLATTTGFSLEAEIPGHFREGDKYKGLLRYGRFKHDIYHSPWDKMWQPPFWKPGRAHASS